MHICELRLRKDHRSVDLISDAPPFGRLWYPKPDDAKFFSRSHDAVIRVHDEAANVIETHEHMAISRGHDQLFSTSLGVLPNC
jgi:hypothetical protein